MANFDPKDAKVRTEGGGKIGLVGKRLPLIIACSTPKCPEKTSVPWEAVKDERMLSRALVEHQGIAYSALGEWSVYGMHLTRTMQAPVDGYAAFCPRCSIAIDAKTANAVANIVAGKINTKL
jgi:translation elongation factor EF-Ts